MDERKKNKAWIIKQNARGNYATETAQLAVLMDIRAELQSLNRLLNCGNFLKIPRHLRRIAINTTKRKRATKRTP